MLAVKYSLALITEYAIPRNPDSVTNCVPLLMPRHLSVLATG